MSRCRMGRKSDATLACLVGPTFRCCYIIYYLESHTFIITGSTCRHSQNRIQRYKCLLRYSRCCDSSRRWECPMQRQRSERSRTRRLSKSYRRCEERRCSWCDRRSVRVVGPMCWSIIGRRKCAVAVEGLVGMLLSRDEGQETPLESV